MITYKIHQIKDIANTDYAFRDYDPKKFNLKDYKKVYESAPFDTDKIFDTELCEEIFTIFNTCIPEGFKGHSLSVSDIVEINVDGSSRFYYCNSLGWQRIT